MISIMKNRKLREHLLSFYELRHHAEVYTHFRKCLEFLLRNLPYSLFIGKLEKEGSPHVQHTINFPTSPKVLRDLSEFVQKYLSKNDCVSFHTEPHNPSFFQHTNIKYMLGYRKEKWFCILLLQNGIQKHILTYLEITMALAIYSLTKLDEREEQIAYAKYLQYISQLKPVLDDKEDNRTTLQRILYVVGEMFNAQAGIMLFDPNDEELVLQSPAFQASEDEIRLYRIRPSQQSNASRVFVTGQAYISNQALGDQNIIQEFVHLYRVQNIATVPIEGKDKRIGVLHVINRKDRGWLKDDLTILSWISSQIGYILENSRLLKEISEQRALAEQTAEQLKQQKQIIEEQRKKLEEQQKDLKQSLSLHQLFTNILLSGQGIAGIMKTLSQHLRCSVILLDPQRRILATEWISKTDRERKLSPGQILLDTAGWKRKTIQHMGHKFGEILMPADESRHHGQWENLLLEQAKLAICVELMYQRSIQDTQNRQKAELLQRLIQGKFQEPDILLNEALDYGHDLMEEHVILVIQMTRGANTSPLLRQLTSYLDNHCNLSYLLLKQIDQLVLLVNLTQLEKRSLTPYRLAQMLQDEIFGFQCQIGISRPCNQLRLYPAAYDEALKAVKLAHTLGKTIVGIDEHRSLEMLLHLENNTCQQYITKVLGPLLEYDRNRGSELLTTLSAYLECNGVLTLTAEKCHTHINTVRYRLQKIEELLQCDLKNNQTLFDLQLALKLLSLQGGTSL
jgi:sugar diacid utilization regulator/GAF domain-containing protein